MPIDQPSMWTSTELHEMMRGFIEAHEKYKHNDIASHQPKAEETPNEYLLSEEEYQAGLIKPAHIQINSESSALGDKKPSVEDLAFKIYNRLLAANYIADEDYINPEQGEFHIRSVLEENGLPVGGHLLPLPNTTELANEIAKEMYHSKKGLPKVLEEKLSQYGTNGLVPLTEEKLRNIENVIQVAVETKSKLAIPVAIEKIKEMLQGIGTTHKTVDIKKVCDEYYSYSGSDYAEELSRILEKALGYNQE